MNKIKPLSKHLINLIAAGEVIERPMNVVKELVENSIDAKATKITINLQDCGIKMIEVIDNGEGISKEDLPIALLKHTTSKIATENDLFNIASLGFRGEALASIASVSDFYIASNNGDTNYFIHKKAEKLIDEGNTNINKGTKIIVKNLFYNTPARYKNLANQYVELSVTEDLINKYALSHPEIAFTLTNNDRVLIKTNALTSKDALTEVASNIYGGENAKCLIAFNSQNDLYQLSGLTSNNEVFKSNKSSITIIVNGRVIRNYSLFKAILDAYSSILPVGKYPITILKINCSYDLLDVNVHPSKLEIRFTDEQGLKSLITKTIKNALIESELLKYQKNELHEDIEIDYQSEKEEEIEEKSWEDEFTFNPSNIKIIEPNNNDKKELLTQLSINSIDDELNIKRHFFQDLRYIGQYNVTYLLMEDNSTLYLIDQHAAMERCMYEKIKKEILDTNTYQTDLIVPLELNFNNSEINILNDLKDEIEKLKIDFNEHTTNSILVRKIPTWIPHKHEVEYLMDIFNAFLNGLTLEKYDVLDDLIKQMSCKKSIKANMAITNDEVKTLMEKLDQCIMPYTCPHGRPTIIKFTQYEIEKLFKRVNQ